MIPTWFPHMSFPISEAGHYQLHNKWPLFEIGRRDIIGYYRSDMNLRSIPQFTSISVVKDNPSKERWVSLEFKTQELDEVQLCGQVSRNTSQRAESTSQINKLLAFCPPFNFPVLGCFLRHTPHTCSLDSQDIWDKHFVPMMTAFKSTSVKASATKLLLADPSPSAIRTI